LHSNDAPTFVALKANDADPELTVPLGPLVIEVSGAEVSGAKVSTVQVRVAGVASTVPAPSFARTEKVCEPPESPE
jgi:hypothetical protein